ncbi:dihydroxyacetone kinase subunit DhaK [Meiothermus granaticius]|uniref:phosphoenolpyruvate--glycerone phosphotransferase n=1 Tax=Meiothermus granaticius NBRC 107808 TaxID=1227551 RepID=A0A399F7E9_9DEIN|nr:dihydroxyacetone kinase subunit DhaK [Meiothermus granaticius]RIH92607.1 PEP-dependent dihydroxyacetone kinase, dihydroxyacetone-binding subunit DhaK [Meiothermus granaticius NBRC 107808]GEM87975.1 dihydroxyacetone kinase subunit DhaK [Meiothermus granaticius NBRC 107808]
MKKILNDPKRFVDEMLEGLYAAHPGMLGYTGGDLRCLVRADAPVQGKVALATGGGSGHLPVFLGYVGRGMLDGCAIGDVFQSPSADQMLAVTRQIHGGKGVLYIYGNYGGDIMNFDMATEMASMEDIEVRTVLVKDDVASAPAERAETRRGVAGMVFAFKTAGAKADQGGSLDEVEAVAQRTLANTRTMGVALGPCILPTVGKPGFTLGEDEMELGMGIHGEPGVRRGKLETADQIAEQILATITADMPLNSGDRVAVMVNGLGATPLEELYILYRRVHQLLADQGVSIHRPFIGEFATSMEMPGASITLFKLDDELIPLLDHPAHTPFFRV